MLVLSRKEGESIILGDRIRIVVGKTKNGRTKIAIDAPDWIKVVRGELIDQVANSVTAEHSSDGGDV